jgi:nucleoside-diphosphate-sugar epimerase
VYVLTPINLITQQTGRPFLPAPMPTVSPPAKVLVSGASGFIAVWVISTLLERGFSVRGTVRSLDKGKHLQKTFERYGDRFELAVVPDIAKVF